MRKRGYPEAYYPKEKGTNILIFLLYLALGIYFMNYTLDFFSVPEIVTNYNGWIIFAGGLLLLFGAINYFRASRSLR